MEEQEKLENRADIFSQVVRAGKRTYFFDVKSTRAGEYFLTITESKKKFAPNGTVSYKKHKIYLYKEDFEKFGAALKDTLEFIENKNPSENDFVDTPLTKEFEPVSSAAIDFDFEDLDDISEK